jgi:hypothetical protein
MAVAAARQERNNIRGFGQDMDAWTSVNQWPPVRHFLPLAPVPRDNQTQTITHSSRNPNVIFIVSHISSHLEAHPSFRF